MTAPPVPLPDALLEAAARGGGAGLRAWLTTLPETIDRVAARWSLTLGAPFQPGGQTAWVAPARAGGTGDLVLKLAWRHPEAEQEADGLRAWDGDGAVRLRASEEFDHTVALLLERCRPGTALATRPEAEQDGVVAGLLLRLWRPPPPGYRFRPLEQMCCAGADHFEQTEAEAPVGLDRGLVAEAMTLLRSLPSSAPRHVLLCTDLHAGNILAAQRRPWLMIDPKPYVGDPTYDPLQHLLNCERRLRLDPLGLVEAMAGLLGLDGERLRLWLFARCVQELPRRPFLGDVVRRIAPL